MPQVSKNALIAITSVLLIYIALGKSVFFSGSPNYFTTPPITQLAENTQLDLISHAGAGLAQGRYSNSLQALQRGYADGSRLFEVDVHLTMDGHPVLLHGWGKDLRQWFNLPLSTWVKSFVSSGAPLMSKSAFSSARMKFGLTQLDLDDFAAWLRRHPDVRVELNIKTDVKRVLADFASANAGIIDQIIAEIYDPEEFLAIRDLGYRNILWVADDFPRQKLLTTAEQLDLYAIALRLNSPLLSFAPDLKKRGVPLWVYTVNSTETAAMLSKIGVAGIYSDSLVYRSD